MIGEVLKQQRFAQSGKTSYPVGVKEGDNIHNQNETTSFRVRCQILTSQSLRRLSTVKPPALPERLDSIKS